MRLQLLQSVLCTVLVHSFTILILQYEELSQSQDLFCPALQSFSTCVAATVTSPSACLESVRTTSPAVVVDLTESLSLTLYLSNLANEYSFLHIATAIGEEIRGTRTFDLYPNRRFQASLLRSALNSFDWTKAVILGSTDPISLAVTKDLADIGTDVSSYLFSDLSVIDNVLSLTIKSSGNNIIVLATSHNLTVDVLGAIHRTDMMKTGYVFFLTSDSLPDSEWIEGNEGVFYVSPVCDSVSVTREEVLTERLSTLLNCTFEQVFDALERDKNFPSLCIFNVQGNRSVLFAESDGLRVSYTSASLIFPGSSTSPPGSVLPIAISISNSVDNPTLGLTPDATSSYITSEFAVKDAGSHLGIITNFDLTWNGVEYGCYEFDSSWALEHLRPSLSELGIAIIGAPASATAIGLSQLLQSLNVSKPLIGSVNTAAVLSSISDFPFFVRVDLSDSRLGEIYAQILKYYGWKHCAVLYMIGDVWSEGLYQDFNKTAVTLGIEILNPVDQRGLDDSLNSTNYQSQVDAIVASQVRIMIFIIYSQYLLPLFTVMYDSGLRKGDVVFLAIEWLEITQVTNQTEPELEIYQEFLDGAIMCNPMAFRGEFGAMVYSELSALGLAPQFSDCLYYDSTLLAAHALQYLLAHGLNYDNPNTMMKELRAEKFIGCSGLVYIDEGTNDRASMAFQVYNLKQSLENQTWLLEPVLTFNPESQQLFQRIGEIQWPDGTNISPTDMIPEGLCPDQKHLSTFPNGERVAAGVCVCVLILTSVMTFFIWKRWWRVKYPTLVSRQEISMEDYFMFLGMAIEFFQVLGMGPDIQELTHLVVYASEASSLNFNSLVYLQKGAFWIMLDSIFIACLVWMLMLVATYCGVFERLHLSTLESMSDRWLPFIGDYCFLPIVSVLLDVFLCDRAYSNSFTSSVLSKDCYFKCWGTTHVLYVTGSAVLLLLWVPAAVFTRPLWQELNNVLHVKTQPEHLLIATIFQITLIVFNKTVKRSQAVVHMILYMLMVGGMAAKMCWRQPHNYARVTMWHVTMYVAALWMGVISIISYFFNAPFGVEVALFAGWGGIAAIGLFLQTVKYKSLLYRKPRKDTRELFRFAFKFSSTESQANIDFNRPNTVREVVKSSEMNAHEFTLSRVEGDPTSF